MGEVDLEFKPQVPVFDANIALGRRHDRRVKVDSVEGTLDAMDKAGIQRALAYSPYAALGSRQEGNQLLYDSISDEPRLFPQFSCNPSADKLDSFATQVEDAGVRSVRMVPSIHKYPFRDWIVKPWLDWMASESLALWVPASAQSGRNLEEVDPSALHDTLQAHADLRVVLAEVHYRHLPWALPFLRDLANVYVDLSWDYSTDGIATLIDAVGESRVIYGSRFPDASMGPQLYHLHRMGLGESTLRAICSGNLERLLGLV